MVIGIGNEYRGDDGVGRQVARRIAALGVHGVEVHESTGECASLMALWRNACKVVLVDASRSDAEPGTVRRFDASSRPLPATPPRLASTHGLSLAEAVELARSLGELPSQVIVFGIEGFDFECGHPLSPEVERAVEEAVLKIQQELADPPACSGRQKNSSQAVLP